MEVAALGGAAMWLFDYNRENFFYDKELKLKRDFAWQGFRIKQFMLYREDVKELVELTVAKMDNYMIVGTLLLGQCVLLVTGGQPRAGAITPWMNWLYGMTAFSAIVYFLLSTWLAMHASVSAHAYGVRLLTQFVRLPVPNTKQIDAARASATDYETQGLGEMFRVPVLRQQFQQLRQQLTEQDSRMAQATDAEIELAAMASPVEALPHIQLVKKLQANWQAYDAYARVCMAMGCNQLLQALGYFVGSMLTEENHALWPALSCGVIFSSCAWLILRLDLYVPVQTLTMAKVLLVLPVALAVFCMALEEVCHPEEGEEESTKCGEAHKITRAVIVPIIFTMQLMWLVFIYIVAKGSEKGGLALPLQFRSVLYLDIFGTADDEAHAEPGLPRLESRDLADVEFEAHQHRPAARPSGLSAVTEESVDRQPDSFRQPSDGAEAASSFDLDHLPSVPMNRQTSIGNMPESLRSSLAHLCKSLAEELLGDFARWQSDAVEQLLDDFTVNAISELRKQFDGAFAMLQRDASNVFKAPATAAAMDASQDDDVWLQLEWNPSGAPIEYWYNDKTEESLFTMPKLAKRIATTPELERSVNEFVDRAYALAEEVTEEAAAAREASAREEAARAAAPPAAPAPPTTTMSSTTSYEEHSTASTFSRPGSSARPPPTMAVSESGSVMSAMSFRVFESDSLGRYSGPAGGSHRGVQLSENATCRHHALGNNPAAGDTFHPHEQRIHPHQRHEQSQSTRRPGVLPWQTFQQATLVLICIWAVGVGWSVARLGFNFDIPLPKPEPHPELAWLATPLPLRRLGDVAWPHELFEPRGIACHPRLGDTAFVADAYGVHRVDLRDGAAATHERPRMQPALGACFASSKSFQANGVRGITAQCEDGTSAAPATAGLSRCVVSLLSSSGLEALQCSVRANATHLIEESEGQLVRLRGGPWRLLASAPTQGAVTPPSYVALGADGKEADAVHLGQRGASAADARPHFELSLPFADQVTSAHIAEQQGAVKLLTLEADNILRTAKKQWGDGSSYATSDFWRLQMPTQSAAAISAEQAERKQHHALGACSTGAGLYVISGGKGDGEEEEQPALWFADFASSGAASATS
eukprot:TRINITY_DN19063_c0_g1_i1.p1 TRINITY_DN19063_c0_g1~~TRINITY_DN19063_c0_g1_i1.p1  ORF type:complete len:1102 (-),score=267.17 TRINITY_DN19063_c0_g1_i1:100-3405(-)